MGRWLLLKGSMRVRSGAKAGHFHLLARDGHLLHVVMLVHKVAVVVMLYLALTYLVPTTMPCGVLLRICGRWLVPSLQHRNDGGLLFGQMDVEGVGSGSSWCRCGFDDRDYMLGQELEASFWQGDPSL
jgi:hypothetical protein